MFLPKTNESTAIKSIKIERFAPFVQENYEVMKQQD